MQKNVTDKTRSQTEIGHTKTIKRLRKVKIYTYIEKYHYQPITVWIGYSFHWLGCNQNSGCIKGCTPLI